LGILLFGTILNACKKDDEDDDQQSQWKTYTYDAVRSWCDPLIISLKADQTVTITVTDSVHTNPTGVVEDCDYWTDADGIADCHYVEQNELLHDLPFMALIGKFNDEYFLVGTYFEHTFTAEGQLELSVNDWGGCGDESDNDGQFVIKVLIE
jgi:hypothetical protein